MRQLIRAAITEKLTPIIGANIVSRISHRTISPLQIDAEFIRKVAMEVCEPLRPDDMPQSEFVSLVNTVGADVCVTIVNDIQHS